MGDEGVALKSDDNKKSRMETLNLIRWMSFQGSINNSIKKVLNITDDLKQKVREELTEMRALKAAARKACQAESDRIFCEKLAKDEAEKRIAAEMAERALKRGEFLKSAGKVGLVVAVLLLSLMESIK